MTDEHEPVFRVRNVPPSYEQYYWVYACNWPDSENQSIRNAVIEVIDWLRASFGPPQPDRGRIERWQYWLDELSDFSGALTIAFARHEDAALFTLTQRVADQ